MVKRRTGPGIAATLAGVAMLWAAADPSAAQTTPDTRNQGITYTSQNRIASIDGPLPGTGDTVAFTYNAKGYIQTVTDEVGHVTTVTDWDARGSPTRVIDPNSVVTVMTYDGRGRTTSVTVDPGPAQSQFSMDYDAVGNLTRETLPMGGWVAHAYDPAGRLTTTSNNRGETVAHVLNAMGDPTSVVVQDGSWSVARQETLSYDEMGRPIQVTGAGARTERQAWDKVSNPVSLTDGRGKVWTTGFDALDRVVIRTDPEGHAVRTGHDALDTLNSFRDGRGLETARAVDGFGQTASEASPDRGQTRYVHDAAGRVVKIVDASNVETRFTHDDAGRPTAQTFPASPGENVTYTWDQIAGGNRGIGRLTQVTDPSGSTAYLYDAQGRVVRVSQTIGARLYVTGYVHDANGEVTRMMLPSGREVLFSRASDGRVTDVATKASSFSEETPLATGVSYRAFGEGLAGWTFGNGLALTRTFDHNGWLTGLAVAGSGAPTLALTLGRDPDGRLVSETDLTAGAARTATHAYADDGRLATSAGPWGSSAFAYDAAGNRTQEQSIRGGATQTRISTYPAGSNRLQEVRDGGGALTRAFAYSARGSVSGDARAGVGTFDYVYNAAGRVSEVKQGGITLGTYGYDWTGRRVRRTAVGTDTLMRAYVYDLDGRLLAEHDGSTGQVVREYVWIEDTPIAAIDAGTGGGIRFLHAGPLDEPLMMTDGVGAVIWSAHREPFGTTRLFGTATASLDLRLPGQFAQGEMGGLHQNWMRDYDPSTGRYLQADPLGIEAGQSLYGYVDQDPLNAVDPTGLSCQARGGRVYCNHPTPGVPSVSFPRPAGWPSYIGPGRQGPSFSYHNYRYRFDLGLGLDPTTATQRIIDNPTPGNRDCPASPRGTWNDVGWIFRQNRNPVRTYTGSAGGRPVIVNVTLPGHELFPGYIIQYSGRGRRGRTGYNVAGEGNNGWQSNMNFPARGLERFIWNRQANQIRNGNQ